MFDITPADVADALRKHNEWRRDDSEISKPMPYTAKELGVFIDLAVEMLEDKHFEELEAEVARLCDALSFYAAENNYKYFLPHPDGEHMGFILPIAYDGGKQAITALATRKQEGGK